MEAGRLINARNRQNRAPRLAIYGVGLYGKQLVRLAVQKGWTVVAAYNRAGEKIGQDVGLLAGLEQPLGVIVQDCEQADYAEAGADVGIVAVSNFLKDNFIAYQRLLGAGMNVLCHGTESYYPYGNDPVLSAQIDALAKTNGVTFTGSGIWDMTRIWSGILLSGPCTELRSLYHRSLTGAAQAKSLADLAPVGVGLSVEEYIARGLNRNPMAVSYKTIPEHVLAAIGYTISATRAYVEPIVLDQDLHYARWNVTIPAGRVLGSRVVGEIETEEGVTARADIDLRLTRDDEVEHNYWAINGEPSPSLQIDRRDPAHTTIATLFNRIPDVIAAPPGIVLLSQLGPLRHSALQGVKTGDRR